MDIKITQQDIIKKLAEKHSMEIKDTEDFVNGMFDLIEDALMKESIVKIKGLGTFKLVDVDSRESVNVNTGERIQIKEHSKISFIPDNVLKEHINKPFSHFETVILNENANFDDVKETNEDEENASTLLDENIVKEDVIDSEDSGIINQAQEFNVEEDSSQEGDNESVSEVESFDDTQPESDIIEEENEETKASTEEQLLPKLEEVSDNLDSIKLDENKFENDVVSEKNDKRPIKDVSKNNNRIYIAIIACVLIIIVAIVSILVVIFSSNSNTVENNLIINTKQLKQVNKPKEIVSDSLINDSVSNNDDFTKIENEIKEDTKIEKVADDHQTKEIVNDEKVDVKNNLSNNNEIIAKHKVKSGETLRTISLKYYNTKEMWNYIFEYNKSKIPNKNYLKLGITLDIPDLKK